MIILAIKRFNDYNETIMTECRALYLYLYMGIRYFLRTGRFSYLLNLRTQNIVGKNADSFYQENESLAKLSLLALLSQSPPVAKVSQKTEKVVKKHLILFSFNNFKFKSEFCML